MERFFKMRNLSHNLILYILKENVAVTSGFEGGIEVEEDFKDLIYISV